MEFFDREKRRQQVERIKMALERLEKVDGPVPANDPLEATKESASKLRAMSLLLLAIAISGFGLVGIKMELLGSSLGRVEASIIRIPERLSAEFGLMRAEMRRQTDSILRAPDPSR